MIQAISGKYGFIRVKATTSPAGNSWTTVPLQEWKLSVRADANDTTSFGTPTSASNTVNGALAFATSLGGISEADVSFSGKYDAATLPVLKLWPGMRVTLFLGVGEDGDGDDIGVECDCNVTGLELGNNVKDLVSFSGTAKMTGAPNIVGV